MVPCLAIHCNFALIIHFITGFYHTAFTFENESLFSRSSVAQIDIPPGALITFLQKGLEYIGIEEHISEVRYNILLICFNLTI